MYSSDRPETAHPEAVAEEILDSIRLLCRVPGVYELRCKDHLTSPWNKITSGYFDARGPDREDNLARMAAAAAYYDGKFSAVYLLLNPCVPDLLARANNRVVEKARDTTKDEHVVRRIWLPVDSDPVRPAGVASSQAELDLAIERTGEVRDWLRDDLRFPDPVFGGSGNGAGLLYAVDLPADAESLDLVKRCLDALSARFSDDRVKIDQAVCNASRIWRLYGTLNCKGEDMPERPHHRSRLIDVPAEVQVVPPRLLPELAGLAQKGKAAVVRPADAPLAADVAPFDMGEYLELHGVEVHGVEVHAVKELPDGRMWVLEECVFNPDHAAPDACVMFRDGKPCYKCFHDSCRQNGWHEFRARLEGWAAEPDPDSPAARIRVNAVRLEAARPRPAPDGGRNEEPPVVVSLKDPFQAAHLHLRHRWTDPEGRRRLLYHRQDYWAYDGRRWRRPDIERVRGGLWRWLREGCVEKGKDGGHAPPRPTKGTIDNVENALRGQCLVPEHVRDMPCWLDGREGPDPDNVIAFANGLLARIAHKSSLACPAYEIA